MQNKIAVKPTFTRRWPSGFMVTAIAAATMGLCCAQAQAAGPAAAAPTVGNATFVAPAGLPRVIILATGGTIAGTADARAANAYNAGAVSGDQLIKAVPGIEKLANLKAEQVASIGSQDMNNKVWFDLARRVQQIFDNNEADAVVITHGTDTMEETAFFLDNVVRTNKPIVLAGAMRPSTAISADGPANLYEAVEVAANPKAKDRGVMVVLNDTIESARWTTKTNSTAVETFNSPDLGPIGYVDPAKVRYVVPPTSADAKKYALPADGKLPRVDIIYSHADMDAYVDQIGDAVKHGAKGIVLAGVGDGNSSKGVIAALHKAAEKGVVVVRSTRVGSGFVNRNVEVNDDQSGFVVSLDLNPQKARILTQLLVANGVTAPGPVQKAFDSFQQE